MTAVWRSAFLTLILSLVVSVPVWCQQTDQEYTDTDRSLVGAIPDAPPRAEGEGPFERMILRGATLIDGTGSPPVGPMDIVIEGNRIVEIRSVGYPGVPIEEEMRPKAGPQDKVIDVEGMVVLPGFVDCHTHTGGAPQGTPAEWQSRGGVGLERLRYGRHVNFPAKRYQRRLDRRPAANPTAS